MLISIRLCIDVLYSSAKDVSSHIDAKLVEEENEESSGTDDKHNSAVNIW